MTWKQSYSEQVQVFNKDRALLAKLMDTYNSTRSTLMDLESRLASTQVVIEVPDELLTQFQDLKIPHIHFTS